ncbi:MAG TPA: helix-turn-helix domain-containing protein [Spirochaetia bacterium]|nr:helix-turn-helix domain-containing protein [Spirochaetia bacterium]
MAFLLFACSAVMLLFACAQLLAKNKSAVHYCMAVSCFLVSYLLFYFWAVNTGFVKRLPAALLSSDISAALLVTPAFYLSSLTILHGGRRPVRSYSAYFIAPSVFAIGFTAYNAFKARAHVDQAGAAPGHFGSPFMTIVTTATYCLYAGAVVLDLLAARRLHKEEDVNNRREFGTQVVFLFAYLGGSLILLSACAVRSDQLIAIAFAVLGLVAVGFTLTCTSILYFPRDSLSPSLLVSAAQQEWDRSAEELSVRLNRLMEESAPYTDPDLTLPRLARMLGEEPKRLSYHFNRTLSTNFRTYINERRLQAVCRDLRGKPDSSILDIAFANGFNSKSSFNTLFMRSLGTTPRAFRQGA